MSYNDWEMEKNDEFVRKMNQEMSNVMNRRNNDSMYMNYEDMNYNNSPINPYMNNLYQNPQYMNNPYMNRPYMNNSFYQNPLMWQNDNIANFDEREIERQAQKDLDYLIEMYPQTARLLQDLIKDECDNIDYEGSIMYDEYPDKVMLRKICAKVHQNYEKMQNNNDTMEMNEANNNELVEGQGVETNNRKPACNGNCKNNQAGIDDLIEVLLFNEMYRRRCRHNRCRFNPIQPRYRY